jgi:hypothetical protein
MKAVGGNSKFNASWEAKFKASGRKRPDDGFTVFQRSQFITDKYVKKVFFEQSGPEDSDNNGSDSEPEKSAKSKSKPKKPPVASVTSQLEAWTLAPPPGTAGPRAASEPLPRPKAASSFFFDDDAPANAVVHVSREAASQAQLEDDFWGESVAPPRSHSLPPAPAPVSAGPSVDFFFDDEPATGGATSKVAQSSLDLLFAPSTSPTPSVASSPAFLDVFSGSGTPITTPRNATVTPRGNFAPVTPTCNSAPQNNLSAFSTGNPAVMINGVNMMSDLRGTGLLVGPYGGMMGGCIVGPPMEMHSMSGMGPSGSMNTGGGMGGFGGMNMTGMSFAGAKSPKPANIMDLFGPTPSPRN